MSKKKNITEKQEQDTMPKYFLLSNIQYFYQYAYREFPKLAAYHAVTVLGRIFLPFWGILMPGIVLHAAGKGAVLHGLAAIALAGLAMLACNSLVEQTERKCYFHENLFRSVLMSDLLLKETRCLYKYIEHGAQKQITKRVYQNIMRGDYAVSYRMLDIPRELIVNTACFFLYSTVLGTLKPWLVAFLFMLSVADYGILRIRNRAQLALRKEFAQSDREISYLNQTFRNTELAKDIRIFAMDGWLMAFRAKIFAERMALEKRSNRKIILTDFLQFLLTLLRNGLAYLFLIQSCLRGEISAAGFLVYFGAITGFSDFITSSINAYSNLQLANEDASCLRAHMELPEIDSKSGDCIETENETENSYDKTAKNDRIARGGKMTGSSHKTESGKTTGHGHKTESGKTITAKTRERLYRQPAEIVFRNVSFSYGEQEIYRHFNLRIRPGEKIALLGVNGAGKTTLVKLLCGLYEPDEGKIFINGVDISTLPKHELYGLFSVVFQESAILPYPVGCNLSFKKLEETDEKRAWAALRRAGLEETFREKGIRMDSFMTNQAFEDGAELSGGQTQRFLLARALYKNGNILILDEPTSALDPIAEDEVYQEYVKISEGRTSLFISHRLASTRFSDRILFLENGRIKEEGTHDRLMGLGGSYAHMFEVQSHYYNKQQERR